MTWTILISKSGPDTRITLIKQDQVTEVFRLLNENEVSLGDIYLGRIASFSQMPKAAFVDLGNGNLGFLPLPPKLKFYEGEKILVQITRLPDEDAGSSKNPRLSLNITLSGKHLLYTPASLGLKLSKKIDQDYREDLQDLFAEVLLEDEGVLVRSLDDGDALLEELETLRLKWSQMQMATVPGLQLKGPTLIDQLLHTYPPEDETLWLTDDLEIYQNLKPRGDPENIKLYHEKIPLFEAFEVEEVWENIQNSIISLPMGGNLVLEKTAVCTTIDVNSHTFKGDDILALNRAAARTISHLITLRDLSGVILIDFLNMPNVTHKNLILQHFKSKFQNDPRTSIHGFTKLGLFEIARARGANRHL